MLTKIPQFGLKALNGFLPVNKPAGVCCNKILFTLRSDLTYIMKYSDMPVSRLEVEYARHLEPFADGLITFVLGWGNQRRRNFLHANYRYRTKIEFGVEREHSCIDGAIIDRANIDHLTFDLLQSTMKDFVGTTLQKRSPFVSQSGNYCDKMTPSNTLYNLINIHQEPRPPKPVQKYPLETRYLDTRCTDITLIDYCKPFADVEISCQGGFSVRQFAEDLATKLETKASLTRLTRMAEGPMQLNDLRVLQIYELNIEHYFNRMPALQDTYKEYMPQFDDLFENDYYKFK